MSDWNPGLCHNGSISLSARKFPRSNKFTLGLHWMQNWSDCRSHRESILCVCVPARAPSAVQSVCALHIHLLPFSASFCIGLRMPQKIDFLWNKKVNRGIRQFWAICLVRTLVGGKAHRTVIQNYSLIKSHINCSQRCILLCEREIFFCFSCKTHQ